MSNNLRNLGVFAKDEYVGKPESEATEYAQSGGFTVRLVEIDGKPLMVTADFKTNRLNFRVRNGIVIDVYGG